jgi:hypothetical protein
MARFRPPINQAREQQVRTLERTLADEVYPALEEFLSEMTRHGIGGQIYGRGTDFLLHLRLDDGFEVAVERYRYREQAHTLPRLVFMTYREEGGHRYCITQGISWDRVKKLEVIAQLVQEYKRWYIQGPFRHE